MTDLRFEKHGEEANDGEDSLYIGKKPDTDYTDPPDVEDSDPPLATDTDSEYLAKRSREPIDSSPSSGATDPEHAARDQNADYYAGRGSWSQKQTEIGGDLERLKIEEDEGEQKVSHRRIDHQQDWQLSGDDGTDGKQLLRDNERKRWLRDWGRRIGLTDHEIDRAEYLLEQVPREIRRGNGDGAAILAALTMAANEAMRTEGVKILRPAAKAIAEGHDAVHYHDDMAETYEQIRQDQDVHDSAVKNVRETIRDFYRVTNSIF